MGMSAVKTNLREFADWSDLASNASEEEIVSWVNKHAETVEARNYHGKKYRLKQQAFVKAAKELLDPDEKELIMKRVGGQL